MFVVNKWTGKQYKVLEKNGNTVTLQRDDGSVLTIHKSELNFNYHDKKEKNSLTN